MLLPAACRLLASLEKEKMDREKLDLSIVVDKSSKYKHVRGVRCNSITRHQIHRGGAVKLLLLMRC